MWNPSETNENVSQPLISFRGTSSFVPSGGPSRGRGIVAVCHHIRPTPGGGGDDGACPSAAAGPAAPPYLENSESGVGSGRRPDRVDISPSVSHAWCVASPRLVPSVESRARDSTGYQGYHVFTGSPPCPRVACGKPTAGLGYCEKSGLTVEPLNREPLNR